VFRSCFRISNFIEHQKTLRLPKLSGVKHPYSYLCIDYCVYPRFVIDNQIYISCPRLTFDEGLHSVSSFLRPRQALGIRLARHARTCNSGAQGQLLLCSLTLLHLGFTVVSEYIFTLLKSTLEKERPRVLSRRHRGI
jgi:hypothetical protein